MASARRAMSTFSGVTSPRMRTAIPAEGVSGGRAEGGGGTYGRGRDAVGVLASVVKRGWGGRGGRTYSHH